MPVIKVKRGYKWGKSGKVYPTRKQAEAQGRAIYAAGYGKKKKTRPKKRNRKKNQKVVEDDCILTRIRKIQ